jgi:hypothetical protein
MDKGGPLYLLIWKANLCTRNSIINRKEWMEGIFWATSSEQKGQSAHMGNLILFIYLYYSFIHMHIDCLGHFSLLPPPSPSPRPLLGRTVSVLFSSSIEE